jgi:PAS domain S-box-containing protein
MGWPSFLSSGRNREINLTATPTSANVPSPQASDSYEPLFRALFDGSQDILLIVDGNTGEILEANHAVEHLLGYQHQDLINEYFTVLFPEEVKVTKKERLDKIQVYGGTFIETFRHRDGSTRTMDLTATMIPWCGESAILVTLRDASERFHAEQEREKLIRELQTAMENIKTLKGLLPICAHCKKIRDDEGYWQDVAVYIREHSEVEFSHGLCPDCIKEFYPELYPEL